MKGARLSSFLPGPGCRRKYANAAVCRRAGVIYIVLAGQGSSQSTGEVGEVCLHPCGCRCVRLCTWRLKGEFKILERGWGIPSQFTFLCIQYNSCRRCILLALLVTQHAFWRGEDMAIWEQVRRSVAGDLTLRATRDPKWQMRILDTAPRTQKSTIN